MKWILSALLIMLNPVSTLPSNLYAASAALTAPSPAAKAAFDDLTKYFPANPRPADRRFATNHLVTTDGNVCHLTYQFYYPSTELELRYEIDFGDVQLDTIEGIAALVTGDRWAGYALKTVSGKQFKAEGNVMGDALRLTNSIKLMSLKTVFDPGALNALLTLAKQCGAK